MISINVKHLIVMAGGAFGSLARYMVSTGALSYFPLRFPFGTLVVNVTGCFLIGLLSPLLSSHPNLRLLFVVGFLGGYTTFSAFALETYMSVRSGNVLTGLLNVIASVTLGYLAVWLGAISVGRR